MVGHQEQDGVYGPAYWFGDRPGAIRETDQHVFFGDAPRYQAFTVWVGLTVFVVSVGTDSGDPLDIASRIPAELGLQGAPIIFNYGGEPWKGPYRCSSLKQETTDRRTLARAEAYVAYQCAWHDLDTLEVILDGESFVFTVKLMPGTETANRLFIG